MTDTYVRILVYVHITRAEIFYVALARIVCRNEKCKIS